MAEFYACVNSSGLLVTRMNLKLIIYGITHGLVLSLYLLVVYIDDIGKLYNTRLGVHVVLYADDIL